MFDGILTAMFFAEPTLDESFLRSMRLEVA